MVTYDKDYFDLHKAGTPHAGIAYGRPWYSIGYMVGALELIHGVFTPDDMRDRLEYL